MASVACIVEKRRSWLESAAVGALSVECHSQTKGQRSLGKGQENQGALEAKTGLGRGNAKSRGG